MRVLFLNPLSELGGAERCLLDLMASMRDARSDLSMDLVVSSSGPLADEADRLGVQVHVVSMPRAVSALGDSAVGRSAVVGQLRLARDLVLAGMSVVAYARRLRRLVRELAPDVIHSNGIKSHLLAAMASGGVPVVWHIRDLIGTRPLVSRALRLAASQASAAIAISKLVERDARSVLGALPIHVVYDAIDTEEFSPGQEDGAWLDTLAGIEGAPADTVRVGLIATYARWKGQDVFIDAISRIPSPPGSRPVRFYIVGGPIYETRGSQFTVGELRELAERAGVAHRLGFVSFQRDIVKVYRSLDIVVHASTQPEPFGRTIAEAMACGRAVVFSSESGAAELVSEFGTATFSSCESATLATAISRLATDDALRERIGAQRREQGVRVFSRARLGAEVLGVLDRLRSRT